MAERTGPTQEPGNRGGLRRLLQAVGEAWRAERAITRRRRKQFDLDFVADVYPYDVASVDTGPALEPDSAQLETIRRSADNTND